MMPPPVQGSAQCRTPTAHDGGIPLNLAQFPRVKLCTAPTPLEFMPRLTKMLGGPDLWIKRDDLTGMGLGGNKVRKLEYLGRVDGIPDLRF
jgi:hypothetical protein